MKQGHYYIKVSNDIYEFTEAVADTVTELAAILGISPRTIYTAMSLAKKRGGICQYRKVLKFNDNTNE